MATAPIHATKLCAKCGEHLPETTEFFFRDYRNSGFIPTCKECRKAYSRKRYAENIVAPREQAREAVPEGEKRCRDCRALKPVAEFFPARECRLGVRPECRVCTIDQQQKKRRENAPPTKFKRKTPKGGKTRFRCPRCMIRKPATPAFFYIETQRTGGLSPWCKPCSRAYANVLNKRPDQRRKRRSIKLNRQANMRGASGYVSPAIIDAMMIEQNGRCHWCDVNLSDYHVDHVIPVSRGGAHERGNLVLACPTCNLTKSNKMPWEWRPHQFHPPT